MRAIRDNSFRARVLAAYHSRCCICGMQLNLTVGAHIVPVQASGSTDETSNGLCLCALDHEAYDQGLIFIRPDYRVTVNEERLSTLEDRRLGSGRTIFVDRLPGAIQLPKEATARPKPEYLERGMRLRAQQA
jgi:putative restriction endonuclease